MSVKVSFDSQSPLYITFVLAGSSTCHAWSAYVLACSRASSIVCSRRAVVLSLGSPISEVNVPIRKITSCPSSWNWASFRIGTVWPKWRSGLVGSKPQ